MAKQPTELTAKQAAVLIENQIIAIMDAGTLYRITPTEDESKCEIMYYARHAHSVWQPSGFSKREAAIQIVREAAQVFKLEHSDAG